MDTHEIVERLNAITDTIDEIINEPELDVGQRAMLSQAQVKVAQVEHELTEFNTEYEEWHDHGE